MSKNNGIPLRDVWKDPVCFSNSHLPLEIRRWLLFPGSFMKKFQEMFGDKLGLRIKILRESQELVRSGSAEEKLFNCRFAYSREIQIYSGSMLIMFAKSVIPKNTAWRFKQQFRSLGQKPLGEVLFSHPRVRRAPYQVAKITPREKEYAQAIVKTRFFSKLAAVSEVRGETGCGGVYTPLQENSSPVPTKQFTAVESRNKPTDCWPPFLWGRRSIFFQEGWVLLLTEVFSKDFLKLIAGPIFHD